MAGLAERFDRALMSAYDVPSNGIVGGYTGDNSAIIKAMVAFSAIAWYNSVELILLICIRFKKWRGLYFWSLIVTSLAIIVYQIGCYGKMNHFIPNHPVVMAMMTNIAWIIMVCGESLVLYSRLHLLSQNRTLLNCVLWGILINGFCCYVPTTVMDLSANIFHTDEQKYVLGYSIVERLQMTLFTLQEVSISAIYLVEAYKFLNLSYVSDKRSRNIMYELLVVNSVIIAIDIGLLTVAQLELFAVEVTMKGLVYSVKLKLELGVLSRLVKIVSSGSTVLQRTTTFEQPSDPPFGMPDFSISPFATEAKRGSISTAASRRRPNFTVPWLATSVRVKSDSRTSIHRARADSFANQEFVTSATVTEGANDDNIRQFRNEIEAELQGCRKNSQAKGRQVMSEEVSRVTTLESPFEEVEQEVNWQPQSAVLNRLRPTLSREDSMEGLTYPGRITGRISNDI